MQRISFIHVTFDFLVTELHFFWTIECEAFFGGEGGCCGLAFSRFPQSVNFTGLISCQLAHQLYVGKVCSQNGTGIKHIFLGEFLMGC